MSSLNFHTFYRKQLGCKKKIMYKKFVPTTCPRPPLDGLCLKLHTNLILVFFFTLKLKIPFACQRFNTQVGFSSYLIMKTGNFEEFELVVSDIKSQKLLRRSVATYSGHQLFMHCQLSVIGRLFCQIFGQLSRNVKYSHGTFKNLLIRKANII